MTIEHERRATKAHPAMRMKRQRRLNFQHLVAAAFVFVVQADKIGHHAIATAEDGGVI